MTDDVVEPIVVNPPTIISVSSPSDLSYVSWYTSVYVNLLEYEKDHPEFYGPYQTKIESEVTENPAKPWIIPNIIASFGAKLIAFQTAIKNLPATTILATGGSKTTTVGEVQRLVDNLDKITIINSTNNGLPSGYGGQNLGSELRITLGTLNGYLLYGREGINFLMLHEVAHNTPTGLSQSQQQMKLHTTNGGNAGNFDDGSVYFREREARNNYIAQSLATGAGIALPSPFKNGLGTLADFPPYGTVPF